MKILAFKDGKQIATLEEWDEMIENYREGTFIHTVAGEWMYRGDQQWLYVHATDVPVEIRTLALLLS